MAYYGLLLFFILEYIRPGTYLPIIDVLHLNTIVPGVIVSVALFTNDRVSNRDVWREPNTRMFLLLMGLIGLSILTADVRLYAFNTLTTVFGYVIISVVIFKQMTDIQRMKGVFNILIMVHLVLAALTPEIITNPETRAYLSSGTFLGDGNDFALSVNIALPLCFFLLFDAEKFWCKIFYAGCLLILVLCIVGTSSRGGTIALACVGLYYWLKSDKKMVFGLLVVLASGMIFASAPPAYFERMSGIQEYETEGSAQGRILAWKSGVRMAMDNPILGVGAGHFPVKYGVEYRPEGYSRTEIPWSTAHSIYFLILGELGFPGLGVLIALIGYNLMANRRLMKDIERLNREGMVRDRSLLTALSASLTAFAVAGAFLSAVYYPHIYVLAGLLAAARRLVRERNSVVSAPAQPLWQPATSYAVGPRP